MCVWVAVCVCVWQRVLAKHATHSRQRKNSANLSGKPSRIGKHKQSSWHIFSLCFGCAKGGVAKGHKERGGGVFYVPSCSCCAKQDDTLRRLAGVFGLRSLSASPSLSLSILSFVRVDACANAGTQCVLPPIPRQGESRINNNNIN